MILRRELSSGGWFPCLLSFLLRRAILSCDKWYVALSKNMGIEIAIKFGQEFEKMMKSGQDDLVWICNSSKEFSGLQLRIKHGYFLWKWFCEFWNYFSRYGKDLLVLVRKFLVLRCGCRQVIFILQCGIWSDLTWTLSHWTNGCFIFRVGLPLGDALSDVWFKWGSTYWWVWFVLLIFS